MNGSALSKRQEQVDWNKYRLAVITPQACATMGIKPNC
jgi:hypothetical protein